MFFVSKRKGKPAWVTQLKPKLGHIANNIIKELNKNRFINLPEGKLANLAIDVDRQRREFAVLDNAEIDPSLKGLISLRQYTSRQISNGDNYLF